ncbi:MAG TPA: hypothetical protein VGT78_00265 [Rhizomicrobium sp.]|nr:hypothetical protein [Rhizomicrobium sp.]
MPKPQNNIKPIVFVIVCLGVVAAMFFGSILISYADVQANRNAAPMQQP